MYKTYILQSEKTGRYYVGSTRDLENRVREHNSGETKSIKSGIPWRLVHVEEFGTSGEALRKETEIKARGAGRYLKGVSNQQPG
ncbi:MAG TPA: GIY-YIG nuclease family protein [Candidatus Kryptobacter bacterium]|nr:GIY-YIG nuclease family protein [Candidatus Kryptobacter bacterium]